MDVDIEEIYALAAKTRTAAVALLENLPLSGGINAATGAGECETTKNLNDAAHALNRVLAYHAKRLNHFADLGVKSARAYEQTEQQNTKRLENTRPGG